MATKGEREEAYDLREARDLIGRAWGERPDKLARDSAHLELANALLSLNGSVKDLVIWADKMDPMKSAIYFKFGSIPPVALLWRWDTGYQIEAGQKTVPIPLRFDAIARKYVSSTPSTYLAPVPGAPVLTRDPTAVIMEEVLRLSVGTPSARP